MSELLIHLHFGFGPAYDGYKIYTYAPGGAIPQNTFSNRNCTVANDNPITLDSNGAALVYLNKPTKLKFTDTADVEIPAWSIDNVGFEARDYLQGYLVVAPTGTTANSYAATTTPAPTALENGLTVIMLPDVDSVGTLGATVFSGAGLNDGYFSGRYTGSTNGSIYTVEIDGTSPDTFKWRKDSGAWTATVAITGVPQLLAEGVYINFPELVGHTLTNSWTLTVNRAAQFNLASLGAKRIYKNIAGILTVLDLKDLTANSPAKISYSSALDLWLLNNVPLVAENHIHDIIRVIKTATFTAVTADKGKLFDCDGTWALNLTTVATLGIGWYCYIRNGGSGTITITANGTEKIYGANIITAGATTYALPAYNAVMIQSNGQNFIIFETGNKFTTAATFTAGATFNGNVTIANKNIVLSTTTGTKFGTASSQKIGFYNATPIVKRSGAAQAALVTTLPVYLSSWGFATSTQANNFTILVNEMRATLVALGLMKGS